MNSNPIDRVPQRQKLRVWNQYRSDAKSKNTRGTGVFYIFGRNGFKHTWALRDSYGAILEAGWESSADACRAKAKARREHWRKHLQEQAHAS